MTISAHLLAFGILTLVLFALTILQIKLTRTIERRNCTALLKSYATEWAKHGCLLKARAAKEIIGRYNGAVGRGA